MSASSHVLPQRPSTASSRATSSRESVPQVESPSFTAQDSIVAPQIAAALKHPLHPARETHGASSTSLIQPLKSALKQPQSELDSTPASPQIRPVVSADPVDPPHAASSALKSAATTPVYASGDDASTQPSTSGYKVGVAFDIMDDEPRRTGGGTGLDFSFTLRAKSSNYERTKQSREFLCCTDGNDYSVNALEWTLENLVEDGDEVVICKVLEAKGDATQKDADEAKEEAQSVMDSIMAKNGSARAISVVVEFVVGPLHTSIQRMIQLYRPDSMVVGTRGKSDSVWRTAFIGSTSRYALERSPVPVIVVRPQRKVRKSLAARQNDPKRRSYAALIEPETGSELLLRPTKTMPLPEARAGRLPPRVATEAPLRTRSLDRTAIRFAELPTPSRGSSDL